MSEKKQSGASVATLPAPVSGVPGRDLPSSPAFDRQLKLAPGFLLVLVLLFIRPLSGLMIYAAGESLHSHIVLIPLICGYLLVIGRSSLPAPGRPSLVPAAVLSVAGIGFLVGAFKYSGVLSGNDYYAVVTSSFLFFLWGGGFAFLGWKWMKAAAFPLAFLVFLVPLPNRAAEWLETASKYASADVAGYFLGLLDVPNLRHGLIYKLPTITIEVAQECSGIRSSWVLFITSLLAAHLFLRSNWRRALLVALVIPLGLLRNGFRIAVIGWLCMEYGPQMIESAIHRRGGPFFFALSLVPLFALLWWLRWTENRRRRVGAPRAGAEA